MNDVENSSSLRSDGTGERLLSAKRFKTDSSPVESSTPAGLARSGANFNFRQPYSCSSVYGNGVLGGLEEGSCVDGGTSLRGLQEGTSNGLPSVSDHLAWLDGETTGVGSR